MYQKELYKNTLNESISPRYKKLPELNKKVREMAPMDGENEFVKTLYEKLFELDIENKKARELAKMEGDNEFINTILEIVFRGKMNGRYADTVRQHEKLEIIKGSFKNK